MTSILKKLAASFILSSALAMPAAAQTAGEIVSTGPKAPVTHVYTIAPDDHFVGDANAPSTLIVYASVVCGHCSDWFNDKWPAIKTDFVDTGKVNVVIREFPTEPARVAMTGFILANCAPDFTRHIEYQMKIQKDLFKRLEAGDGKAAYNEMAAEAGLNSEEEMTACFKDDDAFNHITASMDRADAANIKGVPAFYINGAEHDEKTTVHTALSVLSASGMSKIPGK